MEQQQPASAADDDTDTGSAWPDPHHRRLSTFSGAPTASRLPEIAVSAPAMPFETNGERRRPKPGILRLDMSKPRRSSGGSVEFRAQPQMLGEDIPSPGAGGTSPHQLSVTWATPTCDINEPMQSNGDGAAAVAATSGGAVAGAAGNAAVRSKRSSTQEDKLYEFSSNLTSPVDTIDFPLHYRQSDEDNENNNNDEDDEEDYSISVSAIMQRRASVRGYRNKRGSRNSRRASSPMDHVLDSVERRRSSVYTTSSDEGTNQESTQEQIFENIRLHKEVIQSVKLQPWPIRKKLKLVRQAKMYVARHEGALQERFAMSRSTKAWWARFKILMAARWRHWKRETASFLTVLIPWELRIKEIESHFGSGVASYFTFLRWLMWVNIMIAIPLVAFVIGPEYFATKHDETDPRKRMTEHEFKRAGNLYSFWEFEGFLKYSPMFYGYYSSYSGASALGYQLPMAYFLTSVLVYIYSFVATLRKMAENSRNSKLSSKDDECTFSWKLFTGWDFMIGHAETAHNRIASVVVGFKEALLEEAEKKKDNRNWRIILQRILVNILIIGLLGASGFTVVTLVNSGEELSRQNNWLSRNAVNVTMNLLTFILPMIFEALGLFENWHPRQQLRLQLARIMILNLLNLYSLMFSFIYNINSRAKSLGDLKIKNDTATAEYAQLTGLIEAIMAATTTAGYELSSSTGTALIDDSSSTIGSTDIYSTTETLFTTTAAAIYSTVNRLKCYNITVKCSRPTRISNRTVVTTTLLLMNLTTMLPTATDMLTNLPNSTWTAEPTTFSTNTEELPSSILVTTSPITSTSEQSSTFEATASYDYDDTSSTEPLPGNSTNRTTTTIAVTTTTQSPPTTTASPGNDSFFDYYDYFAGMAIEEDDQDASDAVSIRDLSPKANTRRRRRRDANENPLDKRATAFEDYSSISTSAELATFSTASYNDSTFTSNTVKPLWESNKQLPNVLAYFTTTTTTSEPSTNTTTSTSEATTTTTEFSSTSGSSSTDETTPYYIAEKNIEEVGEPDYYDPDQIENDNFEWCVRTVCEEVTSTSTPEPDTTALDTDNVRPLTQLELYQRNLTMVIATLKGVEKNLTNMCWETDLGQQLSKVIVLDGILAIAAPLIIDFLRALFVRYVNQHWCWDMEKTFPQYGDFKIAENILTLINNQGQVWMGIFFSPGLVLINLVKLMIMMYFRSWIVLTCNVPHEVVFKASKSNNFYLSLLLTMLFLCVLPVGYAIVWLRPSWHCGPFSDYKRISEFITNTTRNALPPQLHGPLDYLTSSSTVIPLLLLLILIIYYLVSLTGALREANQDLRTQLQKEREEERKKIFKRPETKPAEPSAMALTNRWRKVLEASSPVTPTSTQPPDFETEEYKNQARKELISRIMKKALRKGSATSDEDSVVRHGRDDDDTDTEHHDSLPHDEEAKEKRFGLSRLQQIRRSRKPSLIDIVQIAKSERERERVAAITPPAAGVGTGKEPHPKSRFRVEKLERKDKDREKEKEKREEQQTKQSPDDDNDPETNSRIVNERRQSLLRRKLEEDAENSAEKRDPKETTPASASNKLKSKFEIIDEKKPTSVDSTAAKPPLKFKKQKTKPINDPASEPGVFKFDQKTVETSRSKVGKPVEIPTLPSSERLDAPSSDKCSGTPINSPTPTHSAAVHLQANADKLVNFSRQGRKKIGSLLALVREAVNTKRAEDEPQNGKTTEPSTPKATVEDKPLAIDIPPAPQPELVLSTKFQPVSAQPVMPASSSSKTTTSAQPSSKTAAASPSSSKTAVAAAPSSKTAAGQISSKTTAASPSSGKTVVAVPPSSKMASMPSLSQTATPVAPTISNKTTTPSKPKIASVPPSHKTPGAPQVSTTPTTTSAPPTAAQPKTSPKAKPAKPSNAPPATFPSQPLQNPRPITLSIHRSVSQSRRAIERPRSIHQDVPTSIWSDNIPTITISTTGSDECILEPGLQPGGATASTTTTSAPTSPTPVVKIIKIALENDKK